MQCEFCGDSDWTQSKCIVLYMKKGLPYPSGNFHLCFIYCN